MNRTRRTILLLLVAVAAWTTCSADAEQPESSELQPGQCVEEPGVFYSIENHDWLVSILQEEIHRRQQAEDELRVARAQLRTAQEENRALEFRVTGANAQAEIYRLQRPGFLRRHFRICGGLGASSAILGDESAGEVNLAVFGGLCVLP